MLFVFEGAEDGVQAIRHDVVEHQTVLRARVPLGEDDVGLVPADYVVYDRPEEGEGEDEEGREEGG